MSVRLSCLRVSAIFERVWEKKEKEFTVNIISSQCIKVSVWALT